MILFPFECLCGQFPSVAQQRQRLLEANGSGNTEAVTHWEKVSGPDPGCS